MPAGLVATAGDVGAGAQRSPVMATASHSSLSKRPFVAAESVAESSSSHRSSADTINGASLSFANDTATATVTTTDNGGKRQRRNAAGGAGPTASSSTRGVANLTPDQLAKKRANDREAQRAIRERTRNQIESLENRIQELTSQRPYQEMQVMKGQKEAVEAENAEIRRRLAQVISLIQPMLGAAGLDNTTFGNMAASQQFTTQPSPSMRSMTSSNNGMPSPGAMATSLGQAPGIPQPRDPRNYDPSQAAQSIQNAQVLQQRHDLVHGLDMGAEGRLGLDFLLDNHQRLNVPMGLNKLGIPPQLQHIDLSNNMQMPGPSSRMSDHGSPAYNRSSSSGTSYSQAGSNHYELTGHGAPIRNGPPTCPLDNILLDFLHERQKQAADGVATPKLVGPAYPSVSSLLNPARSVNSHPLSKVFTDILATFPDLSDLPEKVAVLYIMFLIMRWQISPTQENYDRLPEWVTPRPSQLFTSHPAWIDHLPFPKMRDRLVRDYNPQDYLFDNFFIPFTTTIDLNWPYEPTDTLLSSPESDELMINPVFERHLRRLENWSLGPAFHQQFPSLKGTYRLKGDVAKE